MFGEKKKRKISEEVDYYTKKESALRHRNRVSDAFLRPPYQHTSLENITIVKEHENDWMK